MLRISRLVVLALTTTMALAAPGGGARADEFPTQPLRLVIPYPPGGALSVHGAIIATSAEPHFQQPMVSLIRAGGGGVVGATFVAQGGTDGHTLLLGEPTINSLRPQVENLPYKSDDFVPVARLTASPIVFVAAANAPFNDLRGMIEYAKANPGRLVYSSDNANGWTYTAFEMLKRETGTQMRGIEFGGGGPALTNVLGGNTMAYAGDPSVVGDHVRQGRLKALCVASDARLRTLDTIPTCKEAGADITWGLWLGIFVKQGTPQARIDRLRTGFAALVRDEGFLTLMGRINSTLAYLDGPQFAEVLRAEQASLQQLYQSQRSRN